MFIIVDIFTYEYMSMYNSAKNLGQYSHKHNHICLLQ
jgi:hypothetical protein